MEKNTEKQAWDHAAGLYQDTFGAMSLYDDTYDGLCKEFTIAGPSVLEIGCGPGMITRKILERVPSARILGLDYSQEMIAIARKLNPDARFEVRDAEHIGAFDQRFDAVVCGFVIPYLSENGLNAMIASVYENLTTKGIFYLSFVEGDPSASGPVKNSLGDTVVFRYYETQSLVDRISASGFHLLREWKIRYEKKDATFENHVVLIFKKQAD